MSEHFAGWDERTLELAVDRVTDGLYDVEERELNERSAAEALEDFEHAVALLSVVGLGELEEPPAELMRAIEAGARQHFGGGVPQAPVTPNAPPAGNQRPSSFSLVAMAGWLAAALLVAAFLLRDVFESASPDARSRRDLLIALAPESTRLDWTKTRDPLAGDATGDVTWNGERQEGYMRFRGLPQNDPTQEQYQLWIFDRSRAAWDERPVDGGVFDVVGDDVVVPIDAKLEVRDPQLFAITLEAPGGVVVSEREHLLLTASP